MPVLTRSRSSVKRVSTDTTEKKNEAVETKTKEIVHQFALSVLQKMENVGVVSAAPNGSLILYLEVFNIKITGNLREMDVMAKHPMVVLRGVWDVVEDEKLTRRVDVEVMEVREKNKDKDNVLVASVGGKELELLVREMTGEQEGQEGEVWDIILGYF